MQEIRSSNPPVVTGICNLNKSRAQHQHSLKIGSKLKYLLAADANENDKVEEDVAFKKKSPLKSCISKINSTLMYNIVKIIL